MILHRRDGRQPLQLEHIENKFLDRIARAWLMMGMVKRSISPRVLDERAFPIRLKLIDPILGDDCLRLRRADEWLRENIGSGRYASHSMDGYGCHTRAYYFCRIEDARALSESFFPVSQRQGAWSFRRWFLLFNAGDPAQFRAWPLPKVISVYPEKLHRRFIIFHGHKTN